MHELPATGFLRLAQICGRKASKRLPAVPALLPISRALWYEGIRKGRFPQPVKLSENVSAWRVEDIRDLIKRMAPENPE